MIITTQFLLSEIKAFLRQRPSWFSMDDLADFISLEDSERLRMRLENILIGFGLAYVIPMDDEGTETWIGRECFFSGKVFPVQVSDLEREQNIFIAGSRFLPFLKPDGYEHEAVIFYKNKELPRKPVFLPFERIANFYFLSTEDDVSHVLCETDEENKAILSEFDEGLDPDCTFMVNAWDFSAVYDECGFVFPLRLFVKIRDWDKGHFEIVDGLYPELTENDIELWLDVFENAVKNSMSVLHTKSSTQEIIAFAYFIFGDFIFGPKAAPMELFFERRNIFGIMPYGIEEKFCVLGAPLPILADWFDYPYKNCSGDEVFFKSINMPVTENALTGLVLSFLSDHYAARFDDSVKETFIGECAGLLVPKRIQNREALLVRCKHIVRGVYEYYADTFNPFTDTALYEIRTSLVYFYRQLLEFVNKLRSLNAVPADFKNQTSLVMNQIVSKLLQCFEFLFSIPEDEYGYINVMFVSLENLSYVYTDVKVDIINTLSAMEKNKGYR